ncbi:hypothetical protein OC846_005929 [Tilletia horrida]|uniref:AAA+ ATPase domain-containing protein n=1 Tax=Tilletia horrida TaxID=155126 RepID=A0AAN6GKU2_9BASI|nr:hypothetical protein OC846_005929 [Tilletia horrida]KAK0560908.1 hypothetical protein OC861_006069 [Tilletia horrida]
MLSERQVLSARPLSVMTDSTNISNGTSSQATARSGPVASKTNLNAEAEELMKHVENDLKFDSDGSAQTSSRENSTVILHVEARAKSQSSMRQDSLRKSIQNYLEASQTFLQAEAEVGGWKNVPILASNLDALRVAESSTGQEFVPIQRAQLQIHIYQPAFEDTVHEFASGEDGADGMDEEQVMAATVAELPNRALDGVWNSLIYADDVKVRLLNYIYTTLLFSDANVDFNIVSWNRVVLLHGPPGTGKTSLCRALAQKLAIRLSDRYTHGKLVEINSHSLFSKWFSESGKLVQRLFSMVTELVEDEDGFVVVLMDEVESLTASRTASMSGSEPSDALRVVNALLTQLDKLKHRKNCLIMTTSNISEAIDNAFMDRADIKQYIGLPPPEAVYWILRSCLAELMRVGLVETVALMDWRAAVLAQSDIPSNLPNVDPASRSASAALSQLAHQCTGMSGRTLRRLPVLAHARYVGAQGMGGPLPMDRWMQAMRKAVRDTTEEIAQTQKTGTSAAASSAARSQADIVMQ